MIANCQPFSYTLEHESPNISLVYGKKKRGFGSDVIYYEHLMAFFEFSVSSFTALRSDGSIICTGQWDDNVDEKSFSNEKIWNVLMQILI